MKLDAVKNQIMTGALTLDKVSLGSAVADFLADCFGPSRLELAKCQLVEGENVVGCLRFRGELVHLPPWPGSVAVEVLLLDRKDGESRDLVFRLINSVDATGFEFFIKALTRFESGGGKGLVAFDGMVCSSIDYAGQADAENIRIWKEMVGPSIDHAGQADSVAHYPADADWTHLFPRSCVKAGLSFKVKDLNLAGFSPTGWNLQLKMPIAWLHPYYPQLALLWHDFPTLGELIQSLPTPVAGMHVIPQALEKQLDVTLEKLEIGLDFASRSVSEIGFRLTKKSAIDLFDSKICKLSMQPALELRIYAPFDSEFRFVEGELSGIWMLGQTKFKTSLRFPDLCFYAGLEGTLDASAVLEEWLELKSGGLPKTTFTKMEVRGSLSEGNKHLVAELSAETKWSFNLGGLEFGVDQVEVDVAYDLESKELSYGMSGLLGVAGTEWSVGADYSPQSGWDLRCSNVKELALRDFLPNLHPELSPDAVARLPDLRLSSLTLTAAPKVGRFSFASLVTCHWSDPFGARGGTFDGTLAVRMERPGENKELSWAVTFDGQFKFQLATQDLLASLSVSFEKDAKEGLKFNGKGTLVVGGNAFVLTFESGKEIQRLTASWSASSDGAATASAGLRFADLAKELGLQAPDELEPLLPTLTEVAFAYDFKDSRLALMARTKGGSQLVFLTAPGKPDRLYGFVFVVNLNLTLDMLPMVGASLGAYKELGLDKVACRVTPKMPRADFNGFRTLIGKGYEELLQSAAKDEAEPEPVVREVVLSIKTGGADSPKPLRISFGGAAKKKELMAGAAVGAGVNRTTADAPAAAPDSGGMWLDVDRSFGPLNLKRIGAAYDNGNIVILFDAGFAVSALTLDLLGLSIGFPIKDFDIGKIHPGLHGMSLAYQSGPITISGGFAKVEPARADLNYEYNGELMIQAEGFGLSAIGSFAEFNNKDRSKSLFLFGVLNAPLGGPAFFVITGVAAGFGYNRNLTLPTLDALPGFPLIAAATGTSPELAKAQANHDAVGALQTMDKYVYPALGENWLAVGLRFTSFKILDSFALLTISFGNRFEIAFLGLSSLTMPPLAPPDAAVGFAQLAIIASYAPDEGVLKVAAQLTPGSYILSKQCHLTGGFALYTWFKDELDKSGALVPNGFRAGDFVVSLGGYNQNFKTPAYYPIVPRVGANWEIDSLTIKGGFYFALTPVAVMAGGALDANFESGKFKAWFSARVDFLLYWEPFYYSASASLSLGASYTLGSGTTAWTITVHVGVDLTLHGPPFGGKAVVDLYVFSVTIPFGTSDPPPPPLKWDAFKERYLEQTNSHALRATQLADAGTQIDSICLSRVSGGLIKELPKGNPAGIDWIVNPEKFEIVTGSKIPCSEAYLQQQQLGTPLTEQRLGGNRISQQFGVTPCGIDNGSLISKHIIKWTTEDGGPVTWACAQSGEILPAVTSRLPRAAWFKDPATDVTKPPSMAVINQDRVTDELTTGFTLKPIVKPTPDAKLLPIAVEQLQVHLTSKNIPGWAVPTIPATDAWPRHEDPAGRLKVLEEVDTITRRDRIAAALKRRNIAVADTTNTRYLANAAKLHELFAAPVLCHLGEPKK